MAALIRQNPGITVREIASELQFADSKSVYYWLEKANFTGIRAFKQQVLAGSQPACLDVTIEGATHYLVNLPLLDWNPQQKNPVGEWYHLYHHPEPRGLYALRVGTNQFGPWFLENDVLIISEQISTQEATWVLLKTTDQYFVGKIIQRRTVNPQTLETFPAGTSAAGTILTQTRQLQP